MDYARRLAGFAGKPFKQGLQYLSDAAGTVESGIAEAGYRSTRDDIPLQFGELTKHCRALEQYKLSEAYETARKELQYAEGEAVRAAAESAAAAGPSGSGVTEVQRKSNGAQLFKSPKTGQFMSKAMAMSLRAASQAASQVASLFREKPNSAAAPTFENAAKAARKAELNARVTASAAAAASIKANHGRPGPGGRRTNKNRRLRKATRKYRK